MTVPKPDARLTVTKDRLAEMRKEILGLVSYDILVGFPDETANRKEETGTTNNGSPILGGKSEITNAALGYIHDKGAPEANIPARPFMIPGILSVEAKIGDQLLSAAKAVLRDPNTNIEARFHRVGLVASTGIKKKINEGVPPPLADATLRSRANRGRKGAMLELDKRAAGELPGIALAKPLIDTGQLRNAVTYVVRKRARKG